MERQTILMGTAAMILMGLIGFYTGFLMEEGLGPATNQSQEYSESVNYTVGEGNDITTVEFDDRSMDLFHEDGEEASFYMDLDQDGSADIQLEDLERDGQIHSMTKVVDVEGKAYRLYFRYKDSSEERGDAQLWLYHVETL